MENSQAQKSSKLRLLLPISIALVLAVIIWLLASTFSGGMTVFAGKRPNNLGVTSGQLIACPNTPNCVNSQSASTDAEHSIAPLTYNSSSAEAIAKLKSVIQGLERTQIITESENYLYAEFKSALMGFVDDVEFYLDEGAKVIHVRSASRLGQSDLGVNRKRIETIRAKFQD